jgi:hypothetical protein
MRNTWYQAAGALNLVGKMSASDRHWFSKHDPEKQDHIKPHPLAPLIVVTLAAILWFLIIYAGIRWLS